MSSPVVLILGAPSTGNHAWARIVRENGGGAPTIRHFGFDRGDSWDSTARALIPTREAWAAMASAKRRGADISSAYRNLQGFFGDRPWLDLEVFTLHYTKAARALAELGIPALPVSYERLVREQEGYARYAVSWLGLEWRGRLHPIRDENRKHLAFPAHEITQP